MKDENDLALFEVTTKDETFFLVSSDRLSGDFAKQLAKSLGISMIDPMPRPLEVRRLEGRVAGRVNTGKAAVPPAGPGRPTLR